MSQDLFFNPSIDNDENDNDAMMVVNDNEDDTDDDDDCGECIYSTFVTEYSMNRYVRKMTLHFCKTLGPIGPIFTSRAAPPTKRLVKKSDIFYLTPLLHFYININCCNYIHVYYLNYGLGRHLLRQNGCR